MTTETVVAHDRSSLARVAVLNGAINAVINGAIQLFLLRGQGPVALSLRSRDRPPV